MNGQGLLFWAFALATAGAAIAVVISQNVVRMAFWLIVALGSTSGLFFLLHADFVGAAQLLVYVGGTLVLLVFGVMLTASGPYVTMKTSPGESVLAAIVATALLGVILSTVGSADWERAIDVAQQGDRARHPSESTGFNSAGVGSTSRPIGMALLGIRVDDLGSTGEARAGYLLPFEIASVHLLVVLVGAAYLARAKRRAQ